VVLRGRCGEILLSDVVRYAARLLRFRDGRKQADSAYRQRAYSDYGRKPPT
jgi:Arc/MetJ-type ribon-helix-helix transcriptional regulator